MREYPQKPLPAVAGIFPGTKGVLLVRRARPPARGLWSFPGGVIRLGESPEEALQREFMEETGLKVRPGPLIAAVSKVYRDTGNRIQYHYVILDYLVGGEEGPLKPGSDAGDVRWVPLGQLHRYEVTDGLMEMIGVIERHQRMTVQQEVSGL